MRRCIPNRKPIQTLPTRRIHNLGPEIRYRPASKHRTKEHPSRIDGDDHNHDIASPAEVSLREDAQVLDQDGEFGAGHGEVVDPDGDVEGLLRLHGVVEGEFGDVLAHAPFHCGTISM
jgi:hypothetical protein